MKAITLKSITRVSVAVVLALSVALFSAVGNAKSAQVVDGGSNLWNLYVASEVFGSGDVLSGEGNLTDLIVLQSLFGSGSGSVFGQMNTNTNTGTDTSGSNLWDLYITSQVFGEGNVGGDNLTDLIILQNLFGSGEGSVFGGTGNGTDSGSSLWDLYIASEVFGSENLNLDSSNLGDLIILGNLFGDGNGLFGTQGQTTDGTQNGQQNGQMGQGQTGTQN